MGGSIVYSGGGGGAARTVSSEIMAIAPKDLYVNGNTRISVTGANVEGEAPAQQAINLTCNNPTTLPAQTITSPSSLKAGQELILINSSANQITFPANAFHPGSKEEVLEAKQMLHMIYMPPVGWIQFDDDKGDVLPVTWFAGDPTWADNGKMRATDKGLSIAKKNVQDPTSRLQTTSFAPQSKVVGASYVLDYEDHTVSLTGGSTGTLTLPNPTTCPGRQVTLISETQPITIAVVGGTSVRVGGNGTISTVPAGGCLQLQVVNGLWRKIGGF